MLQRLGAVLPRDHLYLGRERVLALALGRLVALQPVDDPRGRARLGGLERRHVMHAPRVRVAQRERDDLGRGGCWSAGG